MTSAVPVGSWLSCATIYMVINLNWMEGPSSLCFVSHAVNMMCLTSFCLPKLMTGRQSWNPSPASPVSHLCTATLVTTKKSCFNSCKNTKASKTGLSWPCSSSSSVSTNSVCSPLLRVPWNPQWWMSHSRSRVCTGNVYSHRSCWRGSSIAQHCDISPC